MVKTLANFLNLYWKSLREFFKASPLYATILFILVPIQSVLPAATIAGSQALLTALSHHDSPLAPAVVWSVSVIALGIAGPVVTLTQGLLTDQLVAHINLALMAHAKKLKGIATFETATYYDELEFIRSQASWRPVNLIVFGLDLLRGTLSIVSYIVLLSQFNFVVILLVLLPIIPQAIFTYKIQQDAFETMVDRSPQSRKMQYYAKTLLANTDAKEVRIFNAFDFFIKKYQHTFRQIHRRLSQVRLKQMRISGVYAFINGVALVASLYLVIVGIQNGNYPVASLLTFAVTVVSLSQSLGSLVESSSLLYDTLLFMQKYYQFLNKQDALTTPQNAAALPDKPFAIEFRDVSFAYPETNHKTVLQHVNFKLDPGTTVAVVGENGSGKSTLVKLLLRLYDVSSGQILIDGTPIEQLNVDAYRHQIRVVFQDYSKFNLSLLESVGIADLPNFNAQNVELALKKASAWDNFSNQQIDLQTHFGKQYEDGIEISGGQWQKIAIARAFLNDDHAHLAILDEPTAAIDPRSEFEIYQHFAELSQNKTVLFVTHRLSSVTMADKVLFLKAGKVVGFAPHQVLMQTNAAYAEMYRMQAEGYVKGLSQSETE
ncbi:ABC transporter ATP-binding protein [Lacticaseibacillus rhamnosus]|uniref:ABC transporter ATP-binding protein n=1 Tax=Lacticaseibacillus rhamnosus TaxID=47715 RepID=UPI0007E1682A|nr:ABC transporter ATP-binding protein [Lacticaseibacillus rhamnosus]MCZ2733930.1 ABC transporter ATP-binding protein [Lacticaseibacillus rhamnosus]MCZ2736591.1 ABC transporter ATP-binding protein [Lacticaseibacillus rhamnosus]MCZ2742957.1 ABC transporter ATP-binding protein [Lacticaseibacillus rhamnosus]MCZ2745691.1 ABC transporter ATP-binding protein [Lacticaseibacillus rhamnosus]MCZ2748359.1 ABC transporter ATP-binding protein [Lacticaseibacillus rhamnosus]